MGTRTSPSCSHVWGPFLLCPFSSLSITGKKILFAHKHLFTLVLAIVFEWHNGLIVFSVIVTAYPGTSVYTGIAHEACALLIQKLRRSSLINTVFISKVKTNTHITKLLFVK